MRYNAHRTADLFWCSGNIPLRSGGLPFAAARQRVRDKDIGYDWLGVEVVTWATARRVSGEFSAAREAAAEQRQYDLEQERKLEAEREAYRRDRDASRAKHVFHGVEVSVPGTTLLSGWRARNERPP